MTRESPSPGASTGFRRGLVTLLLAALLLRVAYLIAQPGVDPWFARPVFDGAYYVEWARSIVSGTGGPEGAFYLAPLYPYLLASFFTVAGERLGALYLAQHLLSIGTAGLIAVRGRRHLGDGAALAAAALFLFYPPLLYFASRPLGETVGLALLVCALAAGTRDDTAGGAASGLLAGLAALVRPNLLLVPLFWAAGDALTGRGRRSAALLLAAGVVLVPVGARNLIVSGHPVLVSSNGGMTAYHGNGPGATGVFTAPSGFSGDPARQRAEATMIARLRGGVELDAVEADHWWGRRALDVRLDDPGGSLRLLLRRASMMLDSHEYGLDYAPSLDANPWRPVLRGRMLGEVPIVPLAALIGLTIAALLLVGFRGSGGFRVWSALLACAAAPLLFYVSSRYRLPFSALLTIPAGCGLAALVRRPPRVSARRRWFAVAAALIACALSILVPFHDLKASMRAADLAKRGAANLKLGRDEAARRDIDAAVALAPDSAPVHYHAGLLAESRKDLGAAERHYREAFERDPDLDAAAANLGGMLILAGRAEEAIPVLRRALLFRPTSEVCWNNLVAAFVETGRAEEAALAVAEAARYGADVNPGLVEELERRSNR